MQAMDDMALLREYAANNSETAFAELVSRRIGFVHSAALRQVRDPQLAGEITQAVFVILAQKAGRISEKTILTGWLFRTTRFAALAQIRADTKRRQRELEVQMQSEFQSPAADEIWNQMSPLLDEALATLGETDRQAVLLRFFENKSLAQVGDVLGTGEDTARKRISRALEKLHRYFAKRGVTSTTATIAEKISANSIQAAPAALAKSVSAVAIAKGAAASASTLTLIEGALKIMAWTKVKTAIVVGACVLLVGGTVATSSKWLLFFRDEIRFEAEGTVTYAATWPDATYMKIKHFIVARDGNLWKIRTILEKEETTGSIPANLTNYDLYYEMGFDGTNLFTLEQQDKEKLMPTIPPKVLQAGNYIFADGRVEKANSPPCMDDELLCPVWLAYCSAPYLANLKGNKAVSPLYAAQFLSERIQHLQLPAKWKTNDRYFINNISWFSDGTVEETGPGGKTSIQKYQAPYDRAFLYGRLENSSWTNWSGLSLPGSFKLMVYRPSYQDATNAKPTFVVGYSITGTLDAIRQTGKFSPVPELTMATHITDSRVMRGGRPTPYLSTNRWDYSDAIR